MSTTDAFSGPVSADTTDTATSPTSPTPPAGIDLRTIKPLPAWFFAFEGLFGGTYDILRTSPAAWIALVVLALVNLTISWTVLASVASWSGRC